MIATSNNIIEKALRVALVAHKDQKRKGEDIPYIIHPFMVALKLQSHNFPDFVVASALVHDVIEDSDYPKRKIGTELGKKVLDINLPLTHDNRLPWHERKAEYIKQIKNSNDYTKAVVIADKIHNLESLLILYTKIKDKTWAHFKGGKKNVFWFHKEVYKNIKKTWQHPLLDNYKKLINQLEALQ